MYRIIVGRNLVGARRDRTIKILARNFIDPRSSRDSCTRHAIPDHPGPSVQITEGCVYGVGEVRMHR